MRRELYCRYPAHMTHIRASCLGRSMCRPASCCTVCERLTMKGLGFRVRSGRTLQTLLQAAGGYRSKRPKARLRDRQSLLSFARKDTAAMFHTDEADDFGQWEDGSLRIKNHRPQISQLSVGLSWVSKRRRCPMQRKGRWHLLRA